MKYLVIIPIIIFLFACSITRIERGPAGISVDIYSLGVDRKNIDIDIKREDENEYRAKVKIGNSNQTNGIGKMAEGLVKGVVK